MQNVAAKRQGSLFKEFKKFDSKDDLTIDRFFLTDKKPPLMLDVAKGLKAENAGYRILQHYFNLFLFLYSETIIIGRLSLISLFSC